MQVLQSCLLLWDAVLDTCHMWLHAPLQSPTTFVSQAGALRSCWSCIFMHDEPITATCPYPALLPMHPCCACAGCCMEELLELHRRMDEADDAHSPMMAPKEKYSQAQWHCASHTGPHPYLPEAIFQAGAAQPPRKAAVGSKAGAAVGLGAALEATPPPQPHVNRAELESAASSRHVLPMDVVAQAGGLLASTVRHQAPGSARGALAAEGQLRGTGSEPAAASGLGCTLPARGTMQNPRLPAKGTELAGAASSSRAQAEVRVPREGAELQQHVVSPAAGPLQAQWMEGTLQAPPAAGFPPGGNENLGRGSATSARHTSMVHTKQVRHRMALGPGRQPMKVLASHTISLKQPVAYSTQTSPLKKQRCS